MGQCGRRREPWRCRAARSLERGSLTSARGRLGALRDSTAAAVKAGRLTAAPGAELDASIDRILATLG
ncbi:MAG: hypothetical protein ABI873_05725 [Marmoricola sp.]